MSDCLSSLMRFFWRAKIKEKSEDFEKACGMGNLVLAKGIYSECPDVIISEAFASACSNGHLKTAKWLHDLNKTDDSAQVYAKIKSGESYYLDAFMRACSRQRIEIINWLVHLGVDIHSKKDLAFRKVCFCSKRLRIKHIWLVLLNIWSRNIFLAEN